MNFRDLRRGMIVLGNTIKVLEKKYYPEGRGSRELSTTKTSAQKAMMWTGTYMKFAKLGDNPYAKHDGNRETVADIEPMFDTTNDTFTKDILDKGAIYTIDQIREYLDKQTSALVNYVASGEDSKVYVDNGLSPEELMQASMCIFNIHQNLTETRMWLGMELGRMRDEA